MVSLWEREETKPIFFDWYNAFVDSKDKKTFKKSFLNSQKHVKITI